MRNQGYRSVVSDRLACPAASSSSQCFTALVTVCGKGRAHQLSQAVENMTPAPIGVSTQEIDPQCQLWEVGAYFDQKPDSIELKLIETAFETRSFQLSELPSTNWVAKVNRELTPVKAGRFWVYFAQNYRQAPSETIGIKIASSMAFGTGHHGTTQGCLEMLERKKGQGQDVTNVADIGCGTAVLSIAAYHLWRPSVLASDIDDVAVEVASENIRANGLASRILATRAEGFAHRLHSQRAPFDLIVANILLNPLIVMASDMKQHVSPDGSVILSGIMTDQEDQLLQTYLQAGFKLEDRIEIDDWVSVSLNV